MRTRIWLAAYNQWLEHRDARNYNRAAMWGVVSDVLQVTLRA